MNIVITGASSGIGLALAKSYAKIKVNLLLLGRDKSRLAKCQKTCQTLGANTIIKIVDVTDYQKIHEVLQEFDQQYPIDLIVANAGISAGTSGNGESYQQLKNIFDTNIYGVINSFYPVLEKFKARKSGQIAIMSSMASFKGLPSAPAYSGTVEKAIILS